MHASKTTTTTTTPTQFVSGAFHGIWASGVSFGLLLLVCLLSGLRGCLWLMLMLSYPSSMVLLVTTLASMSSGAGSACSVGTVLIIPGSKEAVSLIGDGCGWVSGAWSSALFG